MKKTRLWAMLAFLIAISAPRILAQTETSSVDPETRAKIQARLQQISTELNLSDAQKQQLQPILRDEIQQLKVVKDDPSMSDEQKKTKAQAIHQSFKSQIAGVLTPEQQKKLESMREEKEEPK